MNELTYFELVEIAKRTEKAVLDKKNEGRLVKDIREEILKDFGIEHPTEEQIGVIQGFIICYYNFKEDITLTKEEFFNLLQTTSIEKDRVSIKLGFWKELDFYDMKSLVACMINSFPRNDIDNFPRNF